MLFIREGAARVWPAGMLGFNACRCIRRRLARHKAIGHARGRIDIRPGALLGVLTLMLVGTWSFDAWVRSIPEPSPIVQGESVNASPFGWVNFDNLLVERGEIRSGGPPKDGIPSLTTASAREPGVERARMFDGNRAPEFVAPRDADWPAGTRVIGVSIGEQARAYPMAVLNYHEIVNDVLGDEAIAVTYCPLCDSVSVVSREIDGRTLEFGVSGLLLHSNVLMYDRTDHALWSQASLQALSGPHVGESLEHLDGWSIATLEDWAARHPESDVMTWRTGFSRNYRNNPYDGYMTSDELMFKVDHQDDRLPRKTRVIGVRAGDRAIALTLDAIRQSPDGKRRMSLTPDRAGGGELVLHADETGVTVVDQPADVQLLHTFWFAWAAFHPETELIEAASTAD